MKVKEVKDFKKYEYLLGLNQGKLEGAVERLSKVLGEDVDVDELVDVLDASYQKDAQDIQKAEVCAYFGIKKSNKKALFWIDKAIKFNGLAHWAEYMKSKCLKGESE